MPLKKPHNMGVWSSFMITDAQNIPELVVIYIYAYLTYPIQSVEKSYKWTLSHMIYRREVSRPAIYVTFQQDNDPTNRRITQHQSRRRRQKTGGHCIKWFTCLESKRAILYLGSKEGTRTTELIALYFCAIVWKSSPIWLLGHFTGSNINSLHKKITLFISTKSKNRNL